MHKRLLFAFVMLAQSFPGLAWSQLDLPGARPGERSSGSSAAGELDLPIVSRSSAQPALAPTLESSVPAIARKSGAAEFVLAEIARERHVDGPLALAAVESLTALGSEGLAAARGGLDSNHAPTLIALIRVCSRHGSSEDRGAVWARLSRALPPAAVQPALEEIVAADPVLAAPTRLVLWLDHPTPAMRSAVARELEAQVDDSLLTPLATVMQSGRADARERALLLLSRIEDESVAALVLAALDDGSPRVRGRAVELAARLQGSGLEERLLTRALDPGAWTRARSLAVLALIEREDRDGRILLDEASIDLFLSALANADAAVRSAAACALAGIGHRSRGSRDLLWLDRDVPHELVRAVSGEVFHPDFAAFVPAATRRLARLTGWDLGSDGPAWKRAWADQAGTFRARRSLLEVRPGDELVLDLRVRWSDDSWRFLGAEASPERASAREEVTLYLSAAEAKKLLARIEELGLLAPERADDRALGSIESTRQVEIALGGGRKRLDLDGQRGAFLESWIEELRAWALENSWQLYPVRGRHETARALFKEESPRFEAASSRAERDRRTVEILLEHLGSVAQGERDAGVAELERVEGRAHLLRRDDFASIVRLLGGERSATDRVRALTALALAASAGGEAGPGGTGEPRAEDALALAETLAVRIDRLPREALAEVLARGGAGAVEGAALHARSSLRAAAAQALEGDLRTEATARLVGLAEDPEPEVVAAALRSLARREGEGVEQALLSRIDAAEQEVRAAVMVAFGRRGGPSARGILVHGIVDPDPRVQAAAAEGLAELADPATASLQATLFARGDRSPAFPHAKRGLARLGQAAIPELLRMGASALGPTGREAALLLSELGEPRAAAPLIALLTDAPQDLRVAEELAILTGIDLRGEPDPASAWWEWWDGVVHDRSLSWFEAGALRAGLALPNSASVEGEGNREGARWLLTVMTCGQGHLEERTRRELARLLGWSIEEIPRSEDALRIWAERIEARF